MKCIKCGQEMYSIESGGYDTVRGNYVKTKHVCPKCGYEVSENFNDLVYRVPVFNPNDYQITIHCMICGKEVVRTKHIPVSTSELVKVCDDCKKAIAWAKENMQKE